jgi:hypothetical protein
MKRLTTATILVGFGVFATGACGDDSDDDAHPGTPHAGSAGRGGSASGSGGKSGRAGQSGRAGSKATAGEGGNELLAAGRGGRGGRGGKGAGASGRAGAGRGGAGRGGTGGGTIGGAGAGGDADIGGAAGVGGGPACYDTTSGGWFDFTAQEDQGTSAFYVSFIASNAFPGHAALLELWLNQPNTGTFVLGTGDNAKWETCQQCVSVNVDQPSGPDRIYFADSGVLSIDDASDPFAGVLDAELTNAHFVELTFDNADPPVSHPVEGGSCLEGVTSHIQVPYEASGGAGGQGGEGGYAGAYDVPTGCIEVSGGAWVSDVEPSYGEYVSLLAPNLGSAAEDGLILAFYSDDVGTFRVGHGVDSRWSTCERCFLVNIQDDTLDGLWFYGAEGTLAVDADSTPMSGILDATATDVTFIQVDASDLETPVPNGDCLHLATATITKP